MAKAQPGVAVKRKGKTKPGTKQVVRSSPRQKEEIQDHELNSLELQLEIKSTGPVEIRDPSEVVSVGDGTVILIDITLNYLQRINKEGKVVRKYPVTLNKGVYYKSACVFGDSLFVATTSKVLKRMSQDESGSSKNYKPGGIGEITYISAIEASVLISDMPNGKTLEYNTEANQITHRVSDVWYQRRYVSYKQVMKLNI